MDPSSPIEKHFVLPPILYAGCQYIHILLSIASYYYAQELTWPAKKFLAKFATLGIGTQIGSPSCHVAISDDVLVHPSPQNAKLQAHIPIHSLVLVLPIKQPSLEVALVCAAPALALLKHLTLTVPRCTDIQTTRPLLWTTTLFCPFSVSRLLQQTKRKIQGKIPLFGLQKKSPTARPSQRSPTLNPVPTPRPSTNMYVLRLVAIFHANGSSSSLSHTEPHICHWSPNELGHRFRSLQSLQHPPAHRWIRHPSLSHIESPRDRDSPGQDRVGATSGCDTHTSLKLSNDSRRFSSSSGAPGLRLRFIELEGLGNSPGRRRQR
jgi:hypothetical protein